MNGCICVCGEDWIVEACDLASGRVRAVLHPQSLDWQVNLNQSGQGSLTLSTREVTSRDIWPGLTSIYISRADTGEGVFAGFIDQFQASDDNTTQVGLQTLDKYLWYRTIKSHVRWVNQPQTDIGRDLVRLAESNGIPLLADSARSDQVRDREWDGWEFKVIGEAIEQLTQVINGPDWEMTHARSEGYWTSTMVFRDRVGLDRDLILRSDIELPAYSITVDASDLATWVDAVGEGEEEDQLRATAVDDSGVYPQFDAVPAWTDVSRITTLQSHADGYLEQHREPDARPAVTISGLDPDPSLLRLGDSVVIQTNFGPITYRGRARIVSISWGMNLDEPLGRTLEVVPLDRPSQSILNQLPTEPCED